MKQNCVAVLIAILSGVACNGNGNGPNCPNPTDPSCPPTAPAPTVSSINPTTGGTSGGTSVTVTGSNFVNGATLTLGNAAATNVQVNNATTIVGTTAGSSAGTVNVVVRNPDGQTGTLASGFTYVSTPSVPVANPGGPYQTRLGQFLTVSGIASTSTLPIAQYRWNCGQSGVVDCVRTTTTPTTQFRYRRGTGTSAQDEYMLSLTVVDTAGTESLPATTEVAVLNSY